MIDGRVITTSSGATATAFFAAFVSSAVTSKDILRVGDQTSATTDGHIEAESGPMRARGMLARLLRSAPDDVKPSAPVVTNARAWLNRFHELARAWSDPGFALSAHGEIVLEWWSAGRKLTIYVGPSSAEYVTVGGPDVDSDMTDGTITSDAEFTRLFEWLVA